MSKAFKTETVTDSKESLRHANRKLEESAVALKPDDSYIEHITSFTIHVYGGVNPLNGNHIYKCVSHQVGGISPTAGGAVIDMIRDHTFRMLGASEQRLAPMTTEETLDELGESAIIKTSLDS